MASDLNIIKPGYLYEAASATPRMVDGFDANNSGFDANSRLPGATLAETAFYRLRKDIVRGVLVPGQKLRVEHLRDAYKIGASPLREALSRLTSSRLVVARGQQGFYVAPVSVSDLLDLTKARTWAQTLALRSAIVYGDREWEARLVAALHRLIGRPSEIGTEIWDRYHTELHDALIAGCGSPSLIEHCTNLQDLSDRYRMLSLTQSKGGRDIQGEHEALVRAVLARDAGLATSLIQEHLIRTTEILLSGHGPAAGSSQLVEQLRAEIKAAYPT